MLPSNLSFRIVQPLIEKETQPVALPDVLLHYPGWPLHNLDPRADKKSAPVKHPVDIAELPSDHGMRADKGSLHRVQMPFRLGFRL